MIKDVTKVFKILINKSPKKFWNIFLNKIKNDIDSKHHDGSYKAKISSHFLRKNSWFLS